jgi:hypothetical protein
MKRPVKSGIASLKALGIVVALGAVAHAGMPYLPLIGPPPLRVQVLKNPNAAVIGKIEALSAAVPTNTLAAIAAKVFPGTTNATGGDAGTGFIAGSGPLLSTGTDKSLEETFSASVLALPTPDLLSITPQMLATYFRPVQFGTNSAALVGPFHVGFMPPQPVPEKSSRAEYIVK